MIQRFQNVKRLDYSGTRRRMLPEDNTRELTSSPSLQFDCVLADLNVSLPFVRYSSA